jgi:hypothetical protein
METCRSFHFIVEPCSCVPSEPKTGKSHLSGLVPYGRPFSHVSSVCIFIAIVTAHCALWQANERLGVSPNLANPSI